MLLQKVRVVLSTEKLQIDKNKICSRYTAYPNNQKNLPHLLSTSFIWNVSKHFVINVKNFKYFYKPYLVSNWVLIYR